MRVRVSDAQLLRDLIRFLQDYGYVAEQASATEADVFVPDAPSETAARLRVRAYVNAWRLYEPKANVSAGEGRVRRRTP